MFEPEEWLQGGKTASVYVRAFPDMAEARKHIMNIVWETEIWIAEIPGHMIQFNGDRLLGPRKADDR
ncbi:MAG: hypothetical protein QOF33_233 [Thermomicrobiales bacterium]|nr:hypothetical protein [Thermomicrobiales bacterium]